MCCILIFLFVLTSCADYNGQAPNAARGNKLTQGVDIDGIKLSLWTAYWHDEGLIAEIEGVNEVLTNISHFAAYFNQAKELFIPDKIMEAYAKVTAIAKPREYRNYLSFVNDIQLGENTSSLKDTDLLYSLFETEEAINKHVEDVLNLTLKAGFDGIEIDYEAINQDLELWQFFIKFIEKLYQSCQEEGIPLRVVLEPKAPLDTIGFPQGPEYVLMCYNLHGNGTEPGPKADKEFLTDIIKKSAHLPGQVNFALATGGFDFQSSGIVAALTEKEATELLLTYGHSPTRDLTSQTLFFNYQDHQGIDHQVWYADKETLMYWIGIILESGNRNISLWKTGGNLSLLDL